LTRAPHIQADVNLIRAGEISFPKLELPDRQKSGRAAKVVRGETA